MGRLIKTVMLMVWLAPFHHMQAQDIPGYNMSNYAGVSGIDLQPASIADMRYRVDITLIGAGLDINNNFLAIQGKYIRDGSIAREYEGNFQNHFLSENNDPVNKAVGLNAYVQLPSFALTLSRDASIGFTCRLRSLFNVDNVNPELAHLAYTGLNVNDPKNRDYFNKPLGVNNLGVNQMSWLEFGLDYARVIYRSGHHLIKAGARIKLEEGIEALYLETDQVNYKWDNNEILNLYSVSFRQGHTQNLVDALNGTFNAQSLRNIAGTSVAFDIGAVYEWRPDYNDFNYRFKAQTRGERRDIVKYKLRLGASILDIGGIGFKKGNNAYDFVADKQNWNVHTLSFGNNKIKGYDSIVAANFAYTNTNSTFVVNLPTTFSIQVDYNIYKDIYINFTTNTSPYWNGVASQVHTLSYYTITPRWDNKWFGFFLPIGINGYGQATLGATARLGPLIVGTGNGLNMLLAKDIYGMNAFAALKIPILYGNPKKKARNNRKDACPAW